jgi:predicted MPP superfamily phosphohydrolase
VALGYAFAEARWHALRHVTAPVLPPGVAPIKILHISDMHMTAGQRRKVAWVRDLARLAPDFVAVTGDNFAFGDSMELALEALEPLLAFPGGFVLGSNDYYAATFKNPLGYLTRRATTPGERQPRRAVPNLPTAAFRGVLVRAGWHHLDNARAAVALGPDRLPVALVGLADPHVGWDEMPPPVPRPADQLGIGLVHAPYVAALRALAHDAVRLILAGHTHGGQVALPGFGALVSNTDLPLRYASGLHHWPASQRGGEVYLHVSKGLGTSPFAPIRFAARPEATLLTLLGAATRSAVA